ncbi:MAG: hypothetical protein V1723_01585 [Candidatus Uhrbacteria bacterium]
MSPSEQPGHHEATERETELAPGLRPPEHLGDVDLSDEADQLLFSLAGRARERQRLEALPIGDLAVELGDAIDLCDQQAAAVRKLAMRLQAIEIRSAVLERRLDVDAKARPALVNIVGRIPPLRQNLGEAMVKFEELKALAEDVFKVYDIRLIERDA